jgi:hypothetical protein
MRRVPTDEELEKLSTEQLQDMLQKRLEKPWVRFEKAVKEEITPLLYHLRKKLHAPGNWDREGWAEWVDRNLSISRRTCDLWTSEYAEKHGLPPFDIDKSTSSKIARGYGHPRPPDTADGKVQISASWVGTIEEEQQFTEAWEILGDESAGRIAFNAVTAAAKTERKKLRRGSIPPKRSKERVQ